MTPAEVNRAALLIDNVKEVEDFLANHDDESRVDVYVTAARNRTDPHKMGLRLRPDQIRPLFRVFAAQLRLELEDMGVGADPHPFD